MKRPLLLLTPDEFNLRLDKVRDAMQRAGADAMLVSGNATIYYLTGRVYAGYIYIPAGDSAPTFFVQRPVDLSGDNVTYIRKPEHIPESLGYVSPENIALETDTTPYSKITRLQALFPSSTVINGSAIMRGVRAIKTPREIELIELSGVKQERVYRRIPHLYQAGMTDLELQVEIERASRLEGCLGQFRISGDSMELYMGNILVGENADTPTPYDFAMGGEGLDPSLPVGCNGSIIKEGNSIMVDINGNYTGYMTDMTRTFSLGQLSDTAIKAHRCSIEICRTLAAEGKPGTEACLLYRHAEEIARGHGLYEYFMGHRQKAGFVGHGLGIEINELPVIAPRSHDILTEGNVVALEPKFVIPGTGAVGIENTYIVTETGMKCLTCAPEDIVSLI